MQFNQITSKYKNVSCQLLKRRDELILVYRIGLALAFACLTGLAAQIRIPLPFTPVPVTGQVLAVLLSGVMLGSIYGGLSQVFYILFGVIGIPWFNGFSGGFSVISGITGGYIIGFIPAALMIGWLTNRYNITKKFHFQMLLMAIGIVIIYAIGALQFSLVMNTSLSNTLKMAVIPFIPVDLIKAVIAAGLSASMLSNQKKKD